MAVFRDFCCIGRQAFSLVALLVLAAGACAQVGPDSREHAVARLLAGRFEWTVSPPLVMPPNRPDDVYYAIKDPSIVRYQGRWHLFCTIRGRNRSHQIEYLAFDDWQRADTSSRHMLKMHDGYYCAPQVFYFRPHNRWYLICQASDDSWDPKYGAAYATAANVADPTSWSGLRPLGHRKANGKSGLDFWIICDGAKAHLFFTTLDGHLWREETKLEDFPAGWSEPKLAIRGDIFEAAHVYRLRGLDKYLAIVEAQGGHGWRYFKAYLAQRLEGPWGPLAATRDKSFASMANTRPMGERWTDSISHGELLRAGYDQHLEVDPAHLQFLFQGVRDEARTGKPYGKIPWRLGLLKPAAPGIASEPK